MNVADTNPYGQEPPSRAIPRKDKNGVSRGASSPAGFMISLGRGRDEKGSGTLAGTRSLLLLGMFPHSL